MRVLFLPLNYGDVIQSGVSDAFLDLGCDVRVFDYLDKYLHCKNPEKVREELINEVVNFVPDLIHLQIQHTTIIDAETIQKIKKLLPKVVISNWTGDVRVYVPPTYKMIAEVADYNLISSTGQIKMFEDSIGKKIHYWQIGYNPKLYNSKNIDYSKKQFKFDAVFIGNYTTKESYPGTVDRLNLCKLLTEKLENKFACYGSGWPKMPTLKGSTDQRNVTSIYQDSFCSISVNHFNDIEHYFSDRLLMSMASGRPVISLKFPKYESFFTNMCDLVIVDSVNDIPDVIDMLKKNTDLANYIGKSGAAKVRAEHTYYSRVKELLNILGF